MGSEDLSRRDLLKQVAAAAMAGGMTALFDGSPALAGEVPKGFRERVAKFENDLLFGVYNFVLDPGRKSFTDTEQALIGFCMREASRIQFDFNALRLAGRANELGSKLDAQRVPGVTFHNHKEAASLFNGFYFRSGDEVFHAIPYHAIVMMKEGAVKRRYLAEYVHESPYDYAVKRGRAIDPSSLANLFETPLSAEGMIMPYGSLGRISATNREGHPRELYGYLFPLSPAMRTLLGFSDRYYYDDKNKKYTAEDLMIMLLEKGQGEPWSESDSNLQARGQSGAIVTARVRGGTAAVGALSAVRGNAHAKMLTDLTIGYIAPIGHAQRLAAQIR